MARVLVIGGGMAGTAAALAAKAAGAEVTVVAAGPGATAFCSGVVWPPSKDAIVLEGFAPVAPGLRIANVLGELRTVGQALPQQTRGAIGPDRKVGVVGLRGAPQLFDAVWAADALRSQGVDAEPLELVLPLTASEVRRSPFEWAAALDGAAEQERWGAGLARLPSKDLLLLPPLIGFGAAAFDRVASLAGREIGELAATTASVPGLRLGRMLEARLKAAGCAIHRAEVASLARGRAVLKSGDTLAFDQAVLATGRFLGGGLIRRPTFAEPLLGLTLAVGDAPAPTADAAIEELAGRRPGEDAPVFRLGLRVNSKQRPLDADGATLDWLVAAGSLIVGPDLGLAFVWATGTVAGRVAASAVVAARAPVGSAA